MSYLSKLVEKFKVGDKILIYGWSGTVADINHIIASDGDHCTYLKVNFDSPREVGYQYEGKWYGGKDGMVSYGYSE